MANKTWKDMGLRLANATSVLTDISAYVNNQSIQSTITDLMTTGMGATSNTRLNGLANISLPVNGFWNSTTKTFFARIINGTSRPLKCEFKSYAGGYFNGSVLPTAVQISGQPDTLELFSVTLNFTGLMNSTSVALT